MIILIFILLHFTFFFSIDKISQEQLYQVMHTIGQNPSETELKDMINEIDINGDGSIDFPGMFTLPFFFYNG